MLGNRAKVKSGICVGLSQKLVVSNSLNTADLYRGLEMNKQQTWKKITPINTAANWSPSAMPLYDSKDELVIGGLLFLKFF